MDVVFVTHREGRWAFDGRNGMTVSTAAIAAHSTTTASSVSERFEEALDRALVRYDAWFLVFVAVILGLGATLLAGMAVWCVVKQDKKFTGAWSFRNGGLKVNMECA